jgi:hypothetical protein
MVDLRRQELIGVRAHDGCDAREFIVDAWGGRGALRDLTSHSSRRRSDRCDEAVRIGVRETQSKIGNECGVEL